MVISLRCWYKNILVDMKLWITSENSSGPSGCQLWEDVKIREAELKKKELNLYDCLYWISGKTDMKVSWLVL